MIVSCPKLDQLGSTSRSINTGARNGQKTRPKLDLPTETQNEVSQPLYTKKRSKGEEEEEEGSMSVSVCVNVCVCQYLSVRLLVYHMCACVLYPLVSTKVLHLFVCLWCTTKSSHLQSPKHIERM